MPELLRIGAIKFYIYSGEENRPHVHVKVREFRVKIWLNELEIAKSSGSARLNKKILELVEIHQEDLLNAWNEFFGEEL